VVVNEIKENNLSKESIGRTIVKKMRWKGKALLLFNVY